MIQPSATFKDNLLLLPPVDGVARIDLSDDVGQVVASIENQPGKQGSLAVYQYLKQAFGALDARRSMAWRCSQSTRPMRGAGRARTPISIACWRSPPAAQR